MEFFCCMITLLITPPLLRRLLRLNVATNYYFIHYSPDLAPSDLYLFPMLKEHLSGTHFPGDNDVIVYVEVFIQGQGEPFYKTGIQSCRNDATIALKLAEIMWKDKLVTVVVFLYI